MHMYPFGAALRGKHRPCGPQGIVMHGSRNDDRLIEMEIGSFTFWCGTIAHLNSTIKTSADISVENIRSDLTVSWSAWIG